MKKLLCLFLMTALANVAYGTEEQDEIIQIQQEQTLACKCKSKKKDNKDVLACKCKSKKKDNEPKLALAEDEDESADDTLLV